MVGNSERFEQVLDIGIIEKKRNDDIFPLLFVTVCKQYLCIVFHYYCLAQRTFIFGQVYCLASVSHSVDICDVSWIRC